MPTVAELKAALTLPVVGAPMFIVSNPGMVVEQCKAEYQAAALWRGRLAEPC